MSKEKRKRKHHGFRNFVLFCLIIGAVWYIGTFTVKTTEVTIKTDKISNNIKIVQLTDLHGSSFGDGNKYLIDRIDDIKPDLIIVTGDMYTSGDRKGMETALSLFGKLAEKYRVYSVNGEHDNDSDYMSQLEAEGVDVLDYEVRDITVGISTIRLYGISNVYYTSTFNLANEFSIDKNMYNILAAHIVNAEAFASFGLDLTLSGDSHGGQIRIPYYGGIVNRNVFMPETKTGDIAYVKGLYKQGDTDIFISSGLGNYPYPVRFLNRPEIAVINLEKK